MHNYLSCTLAPLRELRSPTFLARLYFVMAIYTRKNLYYMFICRVCMTSGLQRKKLILTTTNSKAANFFKERLWCSNSASMNSCKI